MVAESGPSRSHTLTSEVRGAAGEESLPEQPGAGRWLTHEQARALCEDINPGDTDRNRTKLSPSPLQPRKLTGNEKVEFPSYKQSPKECVGF